MFTDLRRLTRLSLAFNDISSVEPRVFDESANLTSLTHIYLYDNQMTELEPWPLIRAQHRPMYVDVRRNRITNFTNALRWSFDCNSTRVFESKLDLAANVFRHITDIIHGWNIDGKALPCDYIIGGCQSASNIGEDISLSCPRRS